jgi:hypothetical protein
MKERKAVRERGSERESAYVKGSEREREKDGLFLTGKLFRKNELLHFNILELLGFSHNCIHDNLTSFWF